MSNRNSHLTSQLGWTPPPPRQIAWAGVELVESSLGLLWPKRTGNHSPAPIFIGRLGLDPLNTGWRHQYAAPEVDLAAFPLQPWRTAYR